MNRKNTILIAVVVNASLLVLLFITALTTQEEILSTPSVQMADTPAAQPRVEPMESPLFGDSADRALRTPATTPEVAPVAIKPVETPIAETPVLHVLPPLSPEATQVKPTPTVEPQATLSGYVDIIVKKGDTLEKIAKAHRTTIDEVIRINQLPSSFLRVGQQLKIPAEKTIASASKPKQLPTQDNPEYYTVKVGDNPWTIAMKHHMKVEELLRLNGLNEEKARKLKPGDRLRTK